MWSIYGIFSSNVHLLKACWEVAEFIIITDLIETVEEWYFKSVSSYVGSPPFISLQVGPTHRYCYGRSQLPLAQLVVRVLPTSIRVPLGRGFELS